MIGKTVLILALAFLLMPLCAVAVNAEAVSIDVQDAFFSHLENLKGQAFEGRVTVGGENDKTFSGNKLIMHVWKKDDNSLYIPFHVGENRSRTWIITKTGSGLQLKHDHRHSDGTHDEMTMYGGHTKDAGWEFAQAFPADLYSKEIFVKGGIPQSTENTWHMYIYPGKTFSYRLTREGREFRVDFDLTKPVTPPPLPWGHEE